MMLLTMNHKRSLQRNQDGIVSLMMTMVMMIVISLIVLGLAQMSRREQNQSLNNQLSMQAFYAAESGVNDAVAAISSGGSLPASNSCNPTIGGVNLALVNKIAAQYDVAYTCVMVSNSGDIKGDLSKVNVWPLQLSSGGNIGTATLTWHPDPSLSGDNSACPAAANVNNSASQKVFTNTGEWASKCPYAVLRVDLVPATTINASSLITGTKTLFLVPTANSGAGSSVNFGSAAVAGVYPGSCSASDCSFDISGLGTKYYMRIIPIYAGGDVSVSPSSGNFVGAQVTVDATGKAQDVLRRIKENVNVNVGNANGNATQPLISGDSICKRVIVYQNSSSDGGAKLCPLGGGGGGSDDDIDGSINPAGLSGSGSCVTNCIFWTRTFSIVKAPATGINSCKWVWGDGQSTAVNDPAQCTVGTTKSHTYPKILKCTTYKVTLTFYTSSRTFTTQSSTAVEPHGKDANC